MNFTRYTALGKSSRVVLAFAAVGAGYTLLQPKLHLESKDGIKAFSFPQTMLFSKQLTVASSEAVNHDTKLITFSLPPNEISGLPPGAAILTQHWPKGGWLPVFRPYTPVHDLEKPGIVQLLVKKYPGGRASGHLHSLSPGDELTVRGPIPNYYQWKPSTTKRDVVFIAGGAGITPIYSLARGVLQEDPQVKIHLLWGVNSSRDILLNEEWAALKSRMGDGLQITYFVSGDEVKATSVPSDFKPGRITEPALRQVLESVGGKEKLGDEKGTKVFLCGPPAMEEALAGKTGILAQLGINKKEIHRF